MKKNRNFNLISNMYVCVCLVKPTQTCFSRFTQPLVSVGEKTTTHTPVKVHERHMRWGQTKKRAVAIRKTHVFSSAQFFSPSLSSPLDLTRLISVSFEILISFFSSVSLQNHHKLFRCVVGDGWYACRTLCNDVQRLRRAIGQMAFW